MPRSKMEPGSHGEISYHDLPDGRVRGTVKFRRIDGSYGKLRIRAASRAQARRTLVEAVGVEYEAAHTTSGGLTPDSLFVELAHEYMEHVAFTGDQRDTTRHENRRLIEKKIAPLMGALALREIKASTILRVYKTIHRETPRQADTCKALISQICSYAVMNDLMVANPAREVKSVRRRPKPIYAPDAMELDQFRAIIRDYLNRDDRMGPRPSDLLGDVVDLILATGARVSEAVGLKWQFVDITSERPTITIAGKIVDSKGQPKHYEDYLKSEAGWRCISVPVELLPMLRRRQLASGGNEFVFHTRTGAPSGTQDVHRSLRRVREWAGLDEELVPHALRKSAVTAVADALGIEGAAQFAGHKRSRVTEQYYAKRAVRAPDTSVVLGSLQRPRAESSEVVHIERGRRAH
ncbi:tyrosine-type recombinase/integrase [Agromyces humi]|uniref:tyrosine-type recombinase/integrase n=1 Tax=Agromyces humi TaxID=1766800 RepID=UPI001358EF6C|nr:tyrosine-type recombinase/integrase [Agromyces humi]